eukprot:691111-Hanusia_phi.AAC.1
MQEDGVKVFESDPLGFGAVQPNGGELKVELAIACSSFKLQAGERVLQVSVLLKDNTSWAPRGHELTWHQQLLPAELSVFPAQLKHVERLRRISTLELLAVEGGDGFRVEWCRKSGGMKGLWYKQTRIIGDSE